MTVLLRQTDTTVLNPAVTPSRGGMGETHLNDSAIKTDRHHCFKSGSDPKTEGGGGYINLNDSSIKTDRHHYFKSDSDSKTEGARGGQIHLNASAIKMDIHQF